MKAPRFAMTDHDEMTGCAAWDEWEQRTATGRILSDIVKASGVMEGAIRHERLGEDQPPIVPFIACARCGARGIPTAANWCPRCGGGGNGWAMLERLPLMASGLWRSR